MNQSKREKWTRDKLFLKAFLKDKGEVTQEELEYFRRHPDEIDEFAAPVTVHKLFLIALSILGLPGHGGPALKDLCYLGGWKDPKTLLECYQQPDVAVMREALRKRRPFGQTTVCSGGLNGQSRTMPGLTPVRKLS